MFLSLCSSFVWFEIKKSWASWKSLAHCSNKQLNWNCYRFFLSLLLFHARTIFDLWPIDRYLCSKIQNFFFILHKERKEKNKQRKNIVLCCLVTCDFGCDPLFSRTVQICIYIHLISQIRFVFFRFVHLICINFDSFFLFLRLLLLLI